MKKPYVLLIFSFVLVFSTPVYAVSNSLVGYWSFNEGNGTIAYDSSGFNNNGIIHGARWTQGKCGKALYFDGVDDYVEIPLTNTLYLTYNFTLEAWVRPKQIINKTSGNQRIVDKDAAYGMLFNYERPWDGRFYGYIYDGKSYVVNTTKTSWEPIWYFMTLTYDGKTLILYINANKTSQEIYRINILKPNNDFIIGAGHNAISQFFNGLIDEVKIYNYALSEEEIHRDMACKEAMLPYPTNHSLLITNTSWRNILAASSVKIPVIVSNSLTQELRDYIDEYKPDYIYTLGLSLTLNNSFMLKRNQIPELFFPNETRAIYVDSREKGIYASQLAYYLNLPLVTEHLPDLNITDMSNNTIQDIQEACLNEIKKNNESVNYLVVANINHISSLLAGRIAAMHYGYIVAVNISNPQYPQGNIISCKAGCWNERNSVSSIKLALNDNINQLASRNLFYKEKHYLNGSFILLTGNIPKIVKDDPVENQWLAWNDPEDGNWFLTDLDYGDLDGDGLLDIAPGRLPESIEESSLLVARLSLNRTSKTALVMAEYLHKFWPIILLYIGGGMWQGKSIEDLLTTQGYNITRLVEYRSNITSLISDLMPSHLKSLVKDADKIGKKAGSMLGKTAGSVASKLFLAIKALQFAEQGLEVYLEYDWKSFTLNMDKAIAIANHFIGNPPHDWEDIVSGVIITLFPDRYPELNVSNVMLHIPDSEIVYYEGIANGTHWILPNPYNHWDIFGSPYNGSVSIYYKEIPSLKSRLFWDNGNMGMMKFGPETVKKGSLSYIGPSAVVYSPYSAELDIRFFSDEATSGQAFVRAVNEFAEDSFTWDPGNWILRGDTVKRKTLREFSLIGDPSMDKDPIISDDCRPQATTTCSLSGICATNIKFSCPYYMISGNSSKTLYIKTSRHILKTGRPILPLLRFEMYLPKETKILNHSFVYSMKLLTNVTFPALVPISHGGNALNITANFSQFPKKPYILNIMHTTDSRTRVLILFSPVKTINKSSAYIYENPSFSLTYESPFMLSVKSSNIKEGAVENITINLEALSDSISGTLLTEITNGRKTFIRKFYANLSIGENFSYILSLHNLTEGRYKIRSFLFSETVLGPVQDFFSVLGKPKLDASNISLVVNEGESAEAVLNITNTGRKVIENVTLSCTLPEGISMHIDNGFDISPAQTLYIPVTLSAENMYPPGDYDIYCTALSSHGETPFSISLSIPPRAVPEFSPPPNLTILPADARTACFEINNTGNIPFIPDTSFLCPDNLSCSLFPKKLSILPGENTTLCLDIKVPGGFAPGIYNSSIVLSAERNYVISIPFVVPETIYWSLSPENIYCNASFCQFPLSIHNSYNSNSQISSITATSLSGFSLNLSDFGSIPAGESENLNLTLSIAREIHEGIYRGEISFTTPNAITPLMLNITIFLNAPRFEIKKTFSPRTGLLLWNKYLIPRKRRVTIALRKTNTVPAEKIHIADSISGWKIRNIRIFSGNHALGPESCNISINQTTLSVTINNNIKNKIIIKYDAFWVPHNASRIVTETVAKAFHNNVYSESHKKTALRTIHINPPQWLEPFFRLFYNNHK